MRPWEYFTGLPEWSRPTRDEGSIDLLVRWLIPPKDPGFSMDKNYTEIGYPRAANECMYYLTISEFSIIYNPYLKTFMLLTGSAGCPPNVLDIYTAPAIAGPWSPQPQVQTDALYVSRSSWDYYAPYTTSSFLQQGGRIMYIVASTYLTMASIFTASPSECRGFYSCRLIDRDRAHAPSITHWSTFSNIPANGPLPMSPLSRYPRPAS